MTDSKKEQKIISKKPISIVLVSVLGALFAIIILVISFTTGIIELLSESCCRY